MISTQSAISHAVEIPTGIQIPVWDPVIGQYSISFGKEEVTPREECGANDCHVLTIASNTAHFLPRVHEQELSRNNFTTNTEGSQVEDTRSPRWMIGTREQIGLVCGAAQQGDVICHFKDSDVAAFIHPRSVLSRYYFACWERANAGEVERASGKSV